MKLIHVTCVALLTAALGCGDDASLGTLPCGSEAECEELLGGRGNGQQGATGALGLSVSAGASCAAGEGAAYEVTRNGKAERLGWVNLQDGQGSTFVSGLPPSGNYEVAVSAGTCAGNASFAIVAKKTTSTQLTLTGSAETPEPTGGLGAIGIQLLIASGCKADVATYKLVGEADGREGAVALAPDGNATAVIAGLPPGDYSLEVRFGDCVGSGDATVQTDQVAPVSLVLVP